jgi:hypothetical protein
MIMMVPVPGAHGVAVMVIVEVVMALIFAVFVTAAIAITVASIILGKSQGAAKRKYGRDEQM